MLKKLSLVLLLSIAPFIANANNVKIGQNVAAVSVEKGGEIFIQDDKESYLPWRTEQMLGKVRVIQAIAGRTSAKAMNAPLMDAITNEHFPESDYQTTTVVNQDDAIWGTGALVKSSTEDGKKDFPWSSMVLDTDGVVAKAWQLDDGTSTIIVQDKSGRVLYNKQGKLTEQDIASVLKLIKKSL
ncbi:MULTISPECIES: YtfJ family protein [Vibrio]|uniref:YtfJ family protein n=1 Tax=Vibrio algicola TaxID=2662262 RepID=A0A5Q0TF02_9VIBR|nr:MULTISPECIES: YtfJ family protein [Vibrio]MBD1576339.1 YtfJ family protein [Vibrio sp. S11_S32]